MKTLLAIAASVLLAGCASAEPLPVAASVGFSGNEAVNTNLVVWQPITPPVKLKTP